MAGGRAWAVFGLAYPKWPHTWGFRSKTLVCFGLFWHQTCCMGSLYPDAAWDCYPGVCDKGQGY